MSEPEIRDCACGKDHDVMPTDYDGMELVCRIHKRHEPCRKCLAEEGFYGPDGRVKPEYRGQP